MNKVTLAVATFMVTLSAISAKAEKYVPLDLKHFSQEMLDWLPKYQTIRDNTKTFTREDGTTYTAVNVDGVTSLTAQLPLDSRGVNQFVNVNELTFSSRAKFIDIRGMKKITRLTNTNFNTGNSVAAGGNDTKAYWEVVLADSTAISEFSLPQCINLRHLSLTGCSELTKVNVPGCDITGLDLSASTKLTYVNVQDNPNLSVLRLPKVAKSLTQLHLCHTNLQELRLPDDWGHAVNPWNQDANTTLTLNIDNTNLRSINLYDLHPKTAFSVLKLSNTKLTSVELAHTYSFGPSSDTKFTNNIYVGHVDSYQIVDPVAHATKAKGMSNSISGIEGGSFDATTGVFTFDKDVEQASYTYTAYNNSGQNITITVNLTRSLSAPTLYLEFDEDNPTLDANYVKYMGSDLLSHVDDSGKNVYNRIRFNYDGDNHYSLPLKHLVGNFHFVVADEDGESVVGAHIADLTSHYSHWNVGRILANPALKQDAETMAYALTPRSYSLHREQPAGKKKLHTRSKDTQYKKSEPYVFTTHPDEFADSIGRLDNVNITVHYIKNDPTNYVQFNSNDAVTGIESVAEDISGTNGGNADVAVEYYTLQGIKVSGDALSPGIYIRRQGDSAEKIAVR